MFEDTPDVEIVNAPKDRHAVYYKKNKKRREARRALFGLIDKAKSQYGSLNSCRAIKHGIFEPAIDTLLSRVKKEGYDSKFLNK